MKFFYLDGCQNPNGRYGWGVMAGRWGDYDVSGLQGSILDGGGYAFFMNSVKLTWPLVPMSSMNLSLLRLSENGC